MTTELLTLRNIHPKSVTIDVKNERFNAAVNLLDREKIPFVVSQCKAFISVHKRDKNKLQTLKII